MIRSKGADSAIDAQLREFDCPQAPLAICLRCLVQDCACEGLIPAKFRPSFMKQKLTAFHKPRGPSALFQTALAGITFMACGGWAGLAVAQEATASGGVIPRLAQLDAAIPTIGGSTLLPTTDLSPIPYADKSNTLLLAQASGGASTGQPLIPITPPNPVTNPYAAADDLKIRGYNIPFPFAVDTVDQGAFGLRNALAADGIGYTGISSTTFTDNVIRHGLPAGNRFGPHSRDLQGYSGQLPTYTTQQTLYMTYDLRKYGIPDGQITLAGQLTSTNWNPGGPNGFDLATATYYQTLFNKRVEIKIGALNNFLEFLGPNVGNSLANGIFGPNASLAIENGLDASAFTTYGVNLQYNFPDHIYNKLDVSRAISPDGSIAEKLGNPTGTNFTVRNAGVLVLDEMGYKVNAGAAQKFTWIRAAGDYSSSNYTILNHTAHRGSPNYGMYFLADRQILQTASHPNSRTGFQGLYVGLSVEFAPEYFDRFSQYFEGRVYGFGLVPGRPKDLASIVLTRNIFSKSAVETARQAGLLAHTNVNAITGSYGFHVLSGLNVNVAAQFTDHPTVITYTRSTGSALNLLVNCFIFL